MLFITFILSLMLISEVTIFGNAVNRPNIIFLLADDLGWNDVSFHGSGEIPTPNIDALAYSGIILNRYYVTPICTPSRSALFTGRYPIHNQMQHRTIYGAEPRGLPLNNTLLSEYLRDLGYSTHIVGKWHLGHYKKVYTPLYRGFDSHFGFWTGHQDYYNHRAYEDINHYYFEGLDMRRNLSVAYDLKGNYSTYLFTNEAVRIVENHNKNKPLFLYVSYGAVHSANPGEPLQAPNETIASLNYIKSEKRRRYAAMVVELDKSVAKIVQSLQDNGLLENSIIIFSTDNGGPADGFNRNFASNYPLRGVKNTLWEGGVRGVGVIWSNLLTKRSFVSEYMFHIKDWLPTLYYVANGNLSNLGNIDGINIWNELQKYNENNNVTTILHNIDDKFQTYAVTQASFKLVRGSTYKTSWDSWYGYSGDNFQYNFEDVLNSTVGRSLNLNLSKTHLMKLRRNATVNCKKTCTNRTCCDPKMKSCLFNIINDACENEDLSKTFPEILKKLEDVILEFNKTALKPNNAPLDPRANPKLWNNTWTNFGDKNYKSNYTNTALEHLIAEISFQRSKDMRQLFKDQDNDFVKIESTRYWTEIFVKHFLCFGTKKNNSKIDSDDLLFFVRKRFNKCSSKQEVNIEVFRRDNKKLPIGEADIDWEETVYLNLIVHEFEYKLTLAICTRTSPKELQVLKKCSRKVYASPSCRRMDVKADFEEITYPLICFIVDNFEEVFCDILVRDGEMVCVELVAADKNNLIQNVIFLGSIRYEALKKVYDSRQSSLSSKMAQKMTFGLFSNASNQRCEYVRMKGPQGKGFAEMVVTKPKGATVETPCSEPGFSLFSDTLDSEYNFNDSEDIFAAKTHKRRLSDPSANLDNFFRSNWMTKNDPKSRSESEGLEAWNNIVAEIEAGDVKDANYNEFMEKSASFLRPSCCGCWRKNQKRPISMYSMHEIVQMSPKIEMGVDANILNTSNFLTVCNKQSLSSNDNFMIICRRKQKFDTLPKEKISKRFSCPVPHLVPFKIAHDGTKIFYLSDLKIGYNICELDDGAYHPLWTMKGYTQTFHLWKENRRINSVPLNVFLTFVTLPWWYIIRDLLDNHEGPILTF